jgi:hypothetical protein
MSSPPPIIGKRGWLVFAAVLSLAVGLEFFVHRHGSFGFDGSFGFNAWYGLLTCVGAVLIAKGLAKFIQRGDDYYDG